MFLPSHRSWLRRLISDPELYKFGKTLLTFIVGGIAGLGLNEAGQKNYAVAVWIGTVVAGFVDFIGASLSLRKAATRESVHELEGCLETLLSIINPPDSPDCDRGLRATLHKSLSHGAEYEQIVDYVGDDRAGHTAGRRFRADAGLAGEVLATGDAVIGTRAIANHETYVRQLMDDWRYTEAEARAKDMSAMSWMAVPLESAPGDIGGILYLDSTKPDFFSDPTRQTAVIASSVGIAKFAVRRYTDR
jgi:hypothetical protein